MPQTANLFSVQSSRMRMEKVSSVAPRCPTCGKQMRLTSQTPTCQSVIYDFSCNEDGDRLSWHRRDPRPLMR
jgi:RNase P subunit RPR2